MMQLLASQPTIANPATGRIRCHQGYTQCSPIQAVVSAADSAGKTVRQQYTTACVSGWMWRTQRVPCNISAPGPAMHTCRHPSSATQRHVRALHIWQYMLQQCMLGHHTRVHLRGVHLLSIRPYHQAPGLCHCRPSSLCSCQNTLRDQAPGGLLWPSALPQASAATDGHTAHLEPDLRYCVYIHRQ